MQTIKNIAAILIIMWTIIAVITLVADEYKYNKICLGCEVNIK